MTNLPLSRLAVLICLMTALACAPSIESEDVDIVVQLERSLTDGLLNAWYPAALDTVHGGFLSDLSHDWRPKGAQNKMIVTQARHVWTCSEAAMFLGQAEYRRMAGHGYRFLRSKMWDEDWGGFYQIRDREGGPVDDPGLDYKSAYGNAFAIYSLATYFKMCADSYALDLAQKTFFWLERHNHDPIYGGYYDRMTRRGEPWNGGMGKDQNSSIHLLEAFTALYRVWPHDLVRRRLHEMLELVRDTIVTPKGCLTLFLHRNWTPVSFRDSLRAVREANYALDHVSFGHDVETAFLMLEASHVLGLDPDIRTLQVAKRMVDHALANGWDAVNGGFYDQGYYFDLAKPVSIISEDKVWWVQAEGLNALLLFSKLYPEQPRYFEAFEKQWTYIRRYLMDHDHGGWYGKGLDKNPGYRKRSKAHDWKVNYHNMRALMNCIKMLRSEHELTDKH